MLILLLFDSTNLLTPVSEEKFFLSEPMFNHRKLILDEELNRVSMPSSFFELIDLHRQKQLLCCQRPKMIVEIKCGTKKAALVTTNAATIHR